MGKPAPNHGLPNHLSSSRGHTGLSALGRLSPQADAAAQVQPREFSKESPACAYLVEAAASECPLICTAAALVESWPLWSRTKFAPSPPNRDFTEREGSRVIMPF